MTSNGFRDPVAEHLLTPQNAAAQAKAVANKPAAMPTSPASTSRSSAGPYRPARAGTTA